jgi:hypothetical protein
MITIRIQVILPSEETREFDLPLNTDINQLYARLVTHENLQTTTSRGEAISYGFYHRRTKQYLPANISLPDAGVRDGDTIDVVPWPTIEPPVHAQDHARFYELIPWRSPRQLFRFAMAALLLVVAVYVAMTISGGFGGGDDADTATATTAATVVAGPTEAPTDTAEPTAEPTTEPTATAELTEAPPDTVEPTAEPTATESAGPAEPDPMR